MEFVSHKTRDWKVLKDGEKDAGTGGERGFVGAPISVTRTLVTQSYA